MFKEDSNWWRVVTNKEFSEVSLFEVLLCVSCQKVNGQGCYTRNLPTGEIYILYPLIYPLGIRLKIIQRFSLYSQVSMDTSNYIYKIKKEVILSIKK